MPEEIKYCVVCGELISDLYHNSYHSHIALKYCPACREKRRREQVQAAKKRNRKKRRIQRQTTQWVTDSVIDSELEILGEKQKELQQQQEQIRLLKEENKLLRESNAQLRAQKKTVANLK
jgi:actin-related protein